MARKTFIAGEDLTGKYGFAIVANEDKVKVAKTANSTIMGILMNDGKADKAVGVAMVGEVTKAKLGGTVAMGDELACDANGKFQKLGDNGVAVALAMQSGVANDLIYVNVL